MPLIAICDHFDKQIPSNWQATVEMRFGKGQLTKVYLCEQCQFGTLATLEQLMGAKIYDVIQGKWSLDQVAQLEAATEDWPTVASWPEGVEGGAPYTAQLRFDWEVPLPSGGFSLYNKGTTVEVLGPAFEGRIEIRFPNGTMDESSQDHLVNMQRVLPATVGVE